MHIHDHLGRLLTFSRIPERVVSLVPSQTELLVDLGLEEKLVGITKFCVHPRDLRKRKKIVGGTKKVHLDKIAELRPDLILCNKEENTKEMVESLEEIGPVHVSDIFTVEDAVQLIQEYGMIFQCGTKAGAMAAEIIEKKEGFVEMLEGQPFRKVGYFIWRNPWMVAGSPTFINHLLELNKFRNVFSGRKERYPEVRLEELLKEEVEVVLLSSEPFPFKDADKKWFREYIPENRVRIVDGEFFSWYGSRLLYAFDYFKKINYNLSS